MEPSFKPIEDVRKIQQLMASVGWRERTEASWYAVLRKSDAVCSVWDGDDLIGIGRLVEDGQYGMTYDLVVHRSFQNKGIGKLIVNALTARATATSIGLFVENHERLLRFYSKLGFPRFRGCA